MIVKKLGALAASCLLLPPLVGAHRTSSALHGRLAALSMGSTKLKAAATASALAMVQTKLAPGESTDGAVFFPTEGKPLGPGRLVVRTNTDVFEFNPEQSGGRAVPNSDAPGR